MRRLFSSFAQGSPGLGLLLMRLVSGTALIIQGYQVLSGGLRFGPAMFQAASMGLGLLLIAGLWTPVVGSTMALYALWNVFASEHPWRWVMLATLGASLALLGPGAWSLDARLYGWRRVTLLDPKRPGGTPPT